MLATVPDTGSVSDQPEGRPTTGDVLWKNDHPPGKNQGGVAQGDAKWNRYHEEKGAQAKQ